MVPVLANLLEQLEKRRDRPKCIEKINSWYWSAIVTHAYSGSTDTQIALDSRQVLEWFNDDDRIPDTVRQAREEMKTINLSQANRMSDAIYKGIMCLTALKGGRDFLKFDMIEFSGIEYMIRGRGYANRAAANARGRATPQPARGVAPVAGGGWLRAATASSSAGPNGKSPAIEGAAR